MGYNWQQMKMKKFFVFAAMTMFMAGAACNAQEKGIVQKSKEAADLAKDGKVSEAANKAKEAVQENKWTGSSGSSTSGLTDKVSKAVEKAREEHVKNKTNGQSSNSNSNSTSDTKATTTSSGNSNSSSKQSGSSNQGKK